MTTSTPARQAHVRTPQALAQIVPHLLGFVPQASMVVIGIEAGTGTVKVTVRNDLPDRPDPQRVRSIAGRAAAVLGGQHLPAAVAVGYGPDELVRPAITALGEIMTQAGIVLGECLRVDGDRYWSYSCQNQACCPETGALFDTADHPASACHGSRGRTRPGQPRGPSGHRRPGHRRNQPTPCGGRPAGPNSTSGRP
jgi:hypothetical protein